MISDAHIDLIAGRDLRERSLSSEWSELFLQ